MSELFEPYAIYLSRSGKQYEVPDEVGKDIIHFTHELLWKEEQKLVLVKALKAFILAANRSDDELPVEQAQQAISISERKTNLP